MLRLASILLGLTLIIAVAFGVAQAQNKYETLVFEHKMECVPFYNVNEVLKKEYNELPLASSKIFLESAKNGRLYEGNLVIYVNPSTETTTLVVNFDEIVCVLGSGVEFGPAGPRIRI